MEVKVTKHLFCSKHEYDMSYLSFFAVTSLTALGETPFMASWQTAKGRKGKQKMNEELFVRMILKNGFLDVARHTILYQKSDRNATQSKQIFSSMIIKYILNKSEDSSVSCILDGRPFATISSSMFLSCTCIIWGGRVK
jgi:hypothetical protein